MSNERIKEAFKRYIISDDQLGFQIDDGWGTGKTYFVRNYLIDKIKEYKFIPIYVSLNGANGIKLLNDKIYNNWKTIIYFIQKIKNKIYNYSVITKINDEFR